MKLQFSYKAKKEIVVLYVTPVPGVSHKADVTLEPWTMGGAMSSSCSSSQVAPRICDLFCQSAPIHSSLQSYSTLPLYSTSLLYYSTNYNIYSRLQAGEEFMLWQNLLLGDAFPMYCLAIMAAGIIGYILALFQIFLVP